MKKKLCMLLTLMIFAATLINAQKSINQNSFALGVSPDGKKCDNYSKSRKTNPEKTLKGKTLPHFLSLLYADTVTGTWYPADSLQTLEAKYTYNGYIDTVIFMQGQLLDTIKRMGVVFSSDNEPIEEVYELYLGPDGWYNDIKYGYYHDGYGNDTLIADFYWNDQTIDWTMSWGEKHEFNYDAYGRIFEDYRYWWETNDLYWVPEELKTYDYIQLSNGFQVVETTKYYDGSGWINNERLTIVFNEEDVVTEILVEQWDYINSVWVNSIQVVDLVWHSFYNADEKFEWDEENGGFLDLNLPTTDEEFDLLYELYYLEGFETKSKVKSCLVNQWDDGMGSWVNLEKFNYVFDEFGGYMGIKEVNNAGVWQNIEKYELFINPKGDVDGYIEYNWDGADWYQVGGPVFTITYEGDLVTNVVWQEFDDNTQTYKNKQEESYWDFINIEGDCQANFSYEVTDLNVFFMDGSSGTISDKVWDFGDGVVWDTLAYDFNYTYDLPGYYDVTFYVFDESTNTSDDTTITILVGSDPNSCMANFAYNIVGLNVDFINNSQGNLTHYYWEFGDGTVAMEEAPSHQYPIDGMYTVTLTAYDENSGCMDIYEEIITVGDASNDCEADFDYFIDPQTRIVYFTNTSVPEVMDNYLWNFGDTYISSMENPTHQYSQEGYYPVCLSIWDNLDMCYNTTCKNIYVEGDNACDASFMYALDAASNTVSFADYSMGDVIAWQYDFGDGSNSNIPDPVHEYTDTGMYLVHLNILTESGCTSDYFELINVNSDYQGLMGLFGYVQDGGDGAKGEPVSFKGAVYGEPSRSVWTFGDGETDSSTLYPKHYYQSNGWFNVCLTVSDPILGQSYTHCQNVKVGPETIDESTNRDFSITVYPNPVKDLAYIEIFAAGQGNVTIELFDILGNKVNTITGTAELNKGLNKFPLSNSNLKNGLYMLKVYTQHSVVTKRIVISK